MLDLIREAWVLASLEYSKPLVRSAHLLAAALGDRMLSLRGQGFVAGTRRGFVVERMFTELKDLLPRVATEENEQEAAAVASRR